MPTIKQLPVAAAISSTDVLPLSQGGLTRSVTVGALLSGTQVAISVASNNLLGRVSSGAGSPESVRLGAGVAIQSGALVANGGDHSGFTLASDLSTADEVVLNSGTTPSRLPATKLRSLFSAGQGVQIDASGVISVTTGGGGASVKVGSGITLSADGTLSVGDVTSAVARATGSSNVRSIADRLSENYSLRDFGNAGYLPGSGGDDLAAFNAAVAKLAAAGGGRLLLPAGTFKISAPIVLPSSGTPLQIIGQGEATVIRPMAAMTAMVVVTSGNVLLADFALTNSASLAAAGLSVTKPADNSRCEFDRLTFASFTKGIWVQNGDVLHFNRPRFVACATAFAIDNGMLNSSIAEMYASGGNGIDVGVPTGVQPEGLQVVGGKILPSTGGSFGVRLRAGLEITFSGLVVDQLGAAGANGFVIDSSSAAIRAIKITSCWTGTNANAAGTGSGIKLIGGATEQLHIDEHTFDSHGAFGLEVDGGDGVLLDLLVTHSRFKSNVSGDVSLKACRAVFLGCDLRHATASIQTAGTQVQVVGLGNRFVANPQLGTLAGGFYAGNVGNTNDSLDGQSIGVNARAPVVAAASLDVLSSGTFRGSAIFQNGLSITAGGASVVGATAITGSLAATGTLTANNLGTGANDPEGAVVATPGAMYQRLAAATTLTDHSLFVKESGTGNTGWRAVATQDFVARTGAAGLPSAPTSALYGGTGAPGSAQPVAVSSTLTLTGGTLGARLATTAQTGVVQPDGTTITISPSGVITAVAGGGAAPLLGSAVPKMDGAAASGSSANAAREDHVHPMDSSRAPVAGPVFTGSLTLPSWTTSARPSSPLAGMEGFATDTARRETYNGSAWTQYVRVTDIPAAGGQLLGGTGSAGQAAAVAVGSGLVLSGGTLSATGSGAAAPRTITAAGSVTVQPTDGLLVINKAVGAATTVTLEATPVSGAVHRIKDGKGDASANPITIVPASGTIDGGSSVLINQNRGAVTLEYNGAEWSIT